MTAAIDRGAILQEIEELRRHLNELRHRIADDDATDELPPGDVQVLLCRVGDVCAAFLQDAVQEVVMMCALTSLPEAPAWAAGVLNLRGIAVPVIDVLVRMTGRSRRRELTDFIVVCRVRDRLIGLVVQEILDVHSAPRQEVQRAGAELEHASYLLGVLYRAEKPILVVSLPRLLAVSDLPTLDAST